MSIQDDINGFDIDPDNTGDYEIWLPTIYGIDSEPDPDEAGK